MGFNELQGGEPANQILQRRFGITGQAPAPVMASELFPTVCLESDRPEWHWLGGGRLVGGRGFLAAAPGNFSQLNLQNPAGSGVIAVVDSIVIADDAGATAMWQIRVNGVGALTVPSASARGFMLDSRAGMAAGFRSSLSIGELLTATIAGQVVNQVRVGANGNYQDIGSYVLGPGSEIVVSPTTQNRSNLVSFRWRERAATPEELTGAIT